MNTPGDVRCTKDHEWVRQDGEAYVVGITDYAQQELGDIVFVDLPEVGSEVRKGESLANVESVKAVSDIYAPIDGTVLEVNQLLNDQAELINASPFTEGWIVKLLVDDASQVEALLSSSEYEQLVAEESK